LDRNHSRQALSLDYSRSQVLLMNKRISVVHIGCGNAGSQRLFRRIHQAYGEPYDLLQILHE
jgi:hypothetical protein